MFPMEYLVVHLLRAVEDIDHDPQGPAQVLGGLRLAGAGRPGWCSTHGQVEGLGEGDVAPVCVCVCVCVHVCV